MNGVTNMLGSLLTYGIGHIKSPILKEYQIIFLFFGVGLLAQYEIPLLNVCSSSRSRTQR